MRSHRLGVAGVLVLIGLVLAGFNVWFAASRSTIPLSLNGTVRVKEVRSEKHPGKDDVYLLELDDGRTVQVDRDVYEAVEEGSQIRKEAWHRELSSAQGPTPLAWSADCKGLAVAMPLVLLVLIATACASTSNRPASA